MTHYLSEHARKTYLPFVAKDSIHVQWQAFIYRIADGTYGNCRNSRLGRNRENVETLHLDRARRLPPQSLLFRARDHPARAIESVYDRRTELFRKADQRLAGFNQVGNFFHVHGLGE